MALLHSRPEHRREALEVLGHTQVRVQREATRHVPYARPDRPEILRDVQPEHARTAAVGQHERGEDAEERRLSTTVRPHEPEQLALANVEGDGIQRDDSAEALRKLPHLHRVAHAPLAGAPMLMSAGIPIFSSPRGFATSTFTAYTRSARSSRVCTGVGVNSAFDDTQLTTPVSAMSFPPASTRTCTRWPSLRLVSWFSATYARS